MEVTPTPTTPPGDGSDSGDDRAPPAASHALQDATWTEGSEERLPTEKVGFRTPEGWVSRRVHCSPPPYTQDSEGLPMASSALREVE